MALSLDNLLLELGYRQSSFYREDLSNTDVSVAHLLRDAQRAHVRGSYFIRTVGAETGATRERPAVYVAEANTASEAREIHRQLWNQGTTPFLLVSMPGQVRIYTGFAYDDKNEKVGQIEKPLDTTSLSLHEIVKRLQYLRSESIDSGDIWRVKGDHLTKEKRVDRALLRTLRSLTQQLIRRHGLTRDVAHSLIGRFVYLHYLREREILSNRWLKKVDVDPDAVFTANAKLNSFRRITDKVDERFNGRIFPINWSSPAAPNADAIKEVARAFAGEEPVTGQMALFSKFDFSFIPIELLSAIYEQFLHDEGRGAEEGAFYTSEPVADYVIAELESTKRLETGMKILDPCCGSGIFLVLSYRRLIEQELRKRNCLTLSPEELSGLLISSIFGIERNSEACLVTEFSLILTLLDYVKPPELHEHTDFRFPELHNRQIFQCDVFERGSIFERAANQFDWIVGNPPWVELDPTDEKEQAAIEWIKRGQETGSKPVARYRTSEAFSWRVRDWIAPKGVVGLITQATSLTNDQSAEYRRAFFSQNVIRRVTNFSNLAYILFESAEEPAATLVYSPVGPADSSQEIVHFGPLVANQPATAPGKNRRRRVPWVLTICESEIQTIPATEAAKGNATTWKRALWGTPRDQRALKRALQVLPTTLGDISKARGWHLNLGLQLRDDRGSKADPNQRLIEIKQAQGISESEAREFAKWFDTLKVIEPKRLRSARSKLTVDRAWLVPNRWGNFVRKGRDAGLDIVKAPHIFLWNDFAAFSAGDFIFRHPKLGLSAPDSDQDWLRAVSVIWTSSITPYFLFLNLSAGWGISRSTIDLGDARQMPMPNLTEEMVNELAKLHRQFSTEEPSLNNRDDWQRRLDQEVASILRVPSQVMLLAREFREFRLPLVKGKVPRSVIKPPDRDQLESYARRLTSELDGFLQRKKRHCVDVLSAPAGIIASINLLNNEQAPRPSVRISAEEKDQKLAQEILQAAEQRYGQWVYVRRSVRVIAGDKIHLCKPARRLEWTESQALLDAADVIAEVTEALVHNA
jgi:hypothetical protein